MAPARRPQSASCSGSVEFADGTLDFSVRSEFHPHKAFGPDLRTLYELGELVDLLAGVFRATWCTYTHDNFGIVGHGEAVTFGQVGEIDKLHAEADVGLVASVSCHGFLPCDAREGFGEIHTLYIFEDVLHKTLEHADHVLLLHEAHLTVYLRELRLAVGAKVFVAEALCNLEVTVESAHHQELLEKLRTLRQSVEFTGIHAGGDHEVAGSFGRGFHQNRRFHLKESVGIEIPADFEGHSVTQFEILRTAGRRRSR